MWSALRATFTVSQAGEKCFPRPQACPEVLQAKEIRGSAWIQNVTP
jgi:hypothetical protein